jgi:hypothetical protein
MLRGVNFSAAEAGLSMSSHFALHATWNNRVREQEVGDALRSV